MAIDSALLKQYFPQLEWRMFEESACAEVPNESRFIDPSITVLDYKDGTYAASLYLNDSLILNSWIEDESLEGVLKSLQEIMSDIEAALSRALLKQEDGNHSENTFQSADDKHNLEQVDDI